jgi:serine/threonine protein kinase
MPESKSIRVNRRVEAARLTDVGELVQQLQDLAAFVQETAAFPGPVPERIGRYRIIDGVGQGGQARVYLGYDALAQRTVMIKWYVGALSSNLDQIISETRAICSVEHDRIIRCWDVDFEQDYPYLVLEPVGGKSLNLVAQQSRCAPQQAAEWMLEICKAVEALHKQGWVHGDLSPPNIVINNDGEPILIDFGLARRICSETDLAAPGTKDFRAPELEHPASQTNPIQCDIYSLGAILHWLLNSASSEAPQSSVVAHPLNRLCQRAMAPDPESRFSNVAEIAEILQTWLRGHRRQSWTRRALRRLSLLTLVTLGILSVVGWGWRPLSSQQLKLRQTRAWQAFSVDSAVARNLTPKFQHDFDLGISCNTSKRDAEGRYLLATGEPFKLTLKPDQSCYIAVYLLSDASPETALQGIKIHPSQSTSQWIPAHQEHQVLLAPTFDNGRTELLYILASTEPWDLPAREASSDSLSFQLEENDESSTKRGIQARAAVSEYLLTFVVE